MLRPAALAALSLALALPAVAQDAVPAGSLACTQTSRDANVIESTTVYDCLHTRDGMQAERYEGVMAATGLDLIYKEGSQITFAVRAPASLAGGAAILGGSYSGLSGAVAIVGGGGSRSLSSDTNSAVSLEPFSVEGTEGVGASVTVDTFTLTPKS